MYFYICLAVGWGGVGRSGLMGGKVVDLALLSMCDYREGFVEGSTYALCLVWNWMQRWNDSRQG